MKHIFILFLSFFIFPAFAVTSESYVDSVVAPLKDEIPAVNTNTVLTNTGTAGEIGQKQIYDANAGYAITNVRPGNSFNNGIFYYDADKVYLRGHSCNGLKCWATPQDGEVFIRFNLLTSQKDVVQMEEGTTATPYVPYGNTYMPAGQ